MHELYLNTTLTTFPVHVMNISVCILVTYRAVYSVHVCAVNRYTDIAYYILHVEFTINVTVSHLDRHLVNAYE